MLYWNVGKIIKTEIFEGNKPKYSKCVIQNIRKELVSEYGRDYSRRNLFNMVKFYEVFNYEEILHTLCTKLTWLKLIYIKELIKVEFNATLALNERWSVHELDEQINCQLYERINLSKKP